MSKITPETIEQILYERKSGDTPRASMARHQIGKTAYYSIINQAKAVEGVIEPMIETTTPSIVPEVTQDDVFLEEHITLSGAVGVYQLSDKETTVYLENERYGAIELRMLAKELLAVANRLER